MPRRPLKLVIFLAVLFFFIFHLLPKLSGGSSNAARARSWYEADDLVARQQKQREALLRVWPQKQKKQGNVKQKDSQAQYPVPQGRDNIQPPTPAADGAMGAVARGGPPPFVAQPAQQQPPTPPRSKPLGKHAYRDDGLLDVNLEGPHPIYELIARAEEEWKAKHAKASKTLAQAVEEYKRRYKRNPPKGFDKWWKYVKDHDVLLPDEYDQINYDIEPFLGLEPSDVIDIHNENEKDKESYTIGKVAQDDPITVLTWSFTAGRYNDLIAGSKQILAMYNEIGADLPPFRLTITPDDRPNRHTDYDVKQSLLEAAQARTFVERAALPKAVHRGWVSACSPDSPARRRPITLENPPPRPAKKTFIHDHVKSMDPCNHPHLFYTHGQFVSHELGPGPQPAMVPEFAACSTLLHHNIRFPTPYAWMDDIYPRSDDPEFSKKQDHRLLWRGSNTGIYASDRTRWKQSQRMLMVELANQLEGKVQIIPSNRTNAEPVGELLELKKALMNPAMMDIAFAGVPISCAPTTCNLIEQLYAWRDKQSVKEAGNYKYVLDVDGNGWSGRFKRLITSNSLIFKATIYPEWYMDRVAPWLHYVPVQVDLSDMYDALVFFRGDGNGDGAHEDLAAKIALAGREWSKRYWRKEDLIAYAYRLTLEYIRVLSPDREAMTYQGRSGRQK